jgi:hypothetical protein
MDPHGGPKKIKLKLKKQDDGRETSQASMPSASASVGPAGTASRGSGAGSKRQASSSKASPELSSERPKRGRKATAKYDDDYEYEGGEPGAGGEAYGAEEWDPDPDELEDWDDDPEESVVLGRPRKTKAKGAGKGGGGAKGDCSIQVRPRGLNAAL